MKFTITISEAPDDMLKIDFEPTVAKILRQLTDSKKCTPAEETVLRIYEFIKNKSIKEERARQHAAKSKIILPGAPGFPNN